MRFVLIYFAYKYNGDWNQIFNALENKEKIAMQSLNKLELMIKKQNWKIITILDLEYPQQFKNAYKPPFVIWVEGDFQILHSKLICATGNQLDPLTQQRIKRFGHLIVKQYHLISGSFAGVDQELFNQTSFKKKVIVAASGLDKFQKNKMFFEHDLLISEYPPQIIASKENFRMRNRLIAALAESLILFSSIKHGGMESMVNHFLNLGKEVYCFPGDGSKLDGNSNLIKQGARLITCIQDLQN